MVVPDVSLGSEVRHAIDHEDVAGSYVFRVKRLHRDENPAHEGNENDRDGCPLPRQVRASWVPPVNGMQRVTALHLRVPDPANAEPQKTQEVFRLRPRSPPTSVSKVSNRVAAR